MSARAPIHTRELLVDLLCADAGTPEPTPETLREPILHGPAALNVDKNAAVVDFAAVSVLVSLLEVAAVFEL
jgi:hypothetical protein